MLELPHTLIGAAIGATIANPLVSLPLSLASHFITDYVPHWNPHLHTEKTKLGHITKKSYTIVIVDAVGALVLGTTIAYLKSQSLSQFLVIMLCCFLSVAPDVVEIPFYFLNKKIAWIEKLITYQRAHQWNVPAFWGILAQVIVSLGALFIIFV